MCWYDDLCSCTEDVDELIRASDVEDFELGTACDLGDTECESCS